MRKLIILTCKRCGYQWPQKGDTEPETCANQKCRSPYWNKERRRRGQKPRQEAV